MLKWNDLLGYWEGDAWAARCDAADEEHFREEREFNALERMSRLYAEMAKEMADEGKTRRWHSLMRRAVDVQARWWAT